MKFSPRNLSKKKLIILLTVLSFCVLSPLKIVYGQLAAETWAQIANDWILMLLDKALEYVLIATFLQIILQIILALSNFLVGFAGGLLNWAITLNTSIPLTRCASGIPCIVDTGWVFTRDIANMFFILALVIIAFATILGIESYGMRRLLVPLILIALLLNFSQVFIGVIVDIANVLIETFAKPFRDGFSMVVNGFQQQTAFFSEAVRGMWVYHFDPTLNYFQNALAGWIGWLLRSLALAIFNLMLAIILFLLAGIFLLRIPMLWILTMISPFFIVLYLFPHFKDKFRWWLDQTLEWTFIGVFSMFFLYLAYQLMIIINDAAFKNQWQYTTFRANLPAQAGGASLESWLITDILPYIVFVIFLFLAFNFAKQTNAIFAGALVAGAVALRGQIEGRLKGVTRAGVREVKGRRPKAISEETEARTRERMAKFPVVGGFLAEREAKKLDQERKEKERKKATLAHFEADTVVSRSGGQEAAALEVLAERKDIEKLEEKGIANPKLRADLDKTVEEGLRGERNIDPVKLKDLIKRYPKWGGKLEKDPIEAQRKTWEAYKKVPSNYIGEEMGKSNIEYLAQKKDPMGEGLDILFDENKAAWGADKFRAVGRRDDVKEVAPIIAKHIMAQGADRAARENYLRSKGREDLISFFDSREGRRIYSDVLAGGAPAGGAPAGGAPAGGAPAGGAPAGGAAPSGGVPSTPPAGPTPPSKPTKKAVIKEVGLGAAVGLTTGPVGLGVYVTGRVAPRVSNRIIKWWEKRKKKKAPKEGKPSKGPETTKEEKIPETGEEGLKKRKEPEVGGP